MFFHCVADSTPKLYYFRNKKGPRVIGGLQKIYIISFNYFLAYLKFLPMNLALAPNSSSIRNN